MVQKKSYQLISRLLCFFIVVTFELYRTSFCLFCFFVYLLTFLVFSIKSFKTVPSYDTSKYSPKQVYRTDVVAVVSIVKMKNFTFLDTFFLLPPTPFASLSFLSRVWVGYGGEAGTSFSDLAGKSKSFSAEAYSQEHSV